MRLSNISEGVNPQLAAIQNSINAHHDNINSRLDVIEKNQDEIEAGIQYLTVACLYNFQASDEGLSQQPAAQIYRWNWLHGMCLRLIVSRSTRNKDRDIYDWFFKWRLGLPLSWSHVVTGRMRIHESWPSCPMLCLRQQNIIPCDSIVIKACENNDVSAIQELFARGQARPNDTTVKNLTLLRVRHHLTSKIPFTILY